MADANTIKKMREAQNAGGWVKDEKTGIPRGINQNGYSEQLHKDGEKYRTFDTNGRIIGSKAGIVVNPVDLTLRSSQKIMKEAVKNEYAGTTVPQNTPANQEPEPTPIPIPDPDGGETL